MTISELIRTLQAIRDSEGAGEDLPVYVVAGEHEYTESGVPLRAVAVVEPIAIRHHDDTVDEAMAQYYRRPRRLLLR